MARCHQLFGNVEEIERNAGAALRSWSRALYLYESAGVTDNAETKRLRQLIRLWREYQSVFVSYAHLDEPLIKPLLALLVERGVRLEIDQDFLGGRSIEAQIRRAIERCPQFLVFFSAAYAGRAWTRFELELYRGKLEADRDARAGDCCLVFVCLPGWQSRAEIIDGFSGFLAH